MELFLALVALVAAFIFFRILRRLFKWWATTVCRTNLILVSAITYKTAPLLTYIKCHYVRHWSTSTATPSVMCSIRIFSNKNQSDWNNQIYGGDHEGITPVSPSSWSPRWISANGLSGWVCESGSKTTTRSTYGKLWPRCSEDHTHVV